MARRHSSSTEIARVGSTAKRVLRLRADARLAASLEAGMPGSAGRIVVVSREPVGVGEAVIVEVSFGALADEIELSGRVEAIDETTGEPGPRAIGIRIDNEHRDRASYIRKVLTGDRQASARNHRRTPTDLDARWRTNGHRFASRIRDISRGGAFIVSRNLPSLGDFVSVEFASGPSPASALLLEGTVSWVRLKGRESGFGVSFKLRDRELAAALHRVVREQERAAESW
ncbi:MAG: PilZ domain-containing protein [Nannocystaceae bacterium]|nr:PilZ domain-containing protein [Nannocystaceae bacterium]